MGLAALLDFFSLRIDHAVKTIWCLFRLKGGKWIKKVFPA